MNHPDRFFGKRPNWILQHQTMRGSAYNQAVYTHLRGMNPNASWRSERALAAKVSEETGFTESAVRKSLLALKRSLFYEFTADGKVTFNDHEVVMGVTTTGYPCSQSGYGGNHFMADEQDVYGTREIESISEELVLPKGRTNVLPLGSARAQDVHNKEGAMFGDMILGADVEDTPTPTLTKKAVNEPAQVFDYFNFIARKVGAAPITDNKDRVAFLAHAKRALSSGLTLQSLMGMINDFFQFDRNIAHRSPWKVFCMKETQQKLMRSAKNVSISDSVLNWISNDFTRTEELPWPEVFDDAFRSLVHRRGMAVAYRYPDLLAQIAKKSCGDLSLAETLITAAATLIDLYLREECDEVPPIIAALSNAGVEVPHDLNRKRIRREALTLQEAVLAAARLATR